MLKGTQATKTTPREKMYLDAVGALYRDAGAGSKSERDEAYKDAMKAVYEKYPDDETRLFYGLSILGTVKEGAQGFAKQSIAARLFEEVYAKNPQHPGVLHYLIHVYDDPEHAVDGLKAARALLGASVCLHLSAPAEVAPLAVAHAVEAAQPAVVRVAPQLPLAAQLLLAARSPLAARLPLAPQLPLAARSPSARLSLAVARPLLALAPPSSAGLRVRLAPAEEVCVQRARRRLLLLLLLLLLLRLPRRRLGLRNRLAVVLNFQLCIHGPFRNVEDLHEMIMVFRT